MKIVILGVGNRMRGDDAIGSIIAEEILRLAQNDRQFMCHSEGAEATEESHKLIIYDTETTPENFIEKVVGLKPDRLIFIDACNFGGQAGEYKLFEDEEIKEIAYGLLSTHTLPLVLTIELIKKQHNCKVALLGIQPKSFTMGSDLSSELIGVKDNIIQFIKKLITE
jgi:hydrogenase 3 maturation protease